MCVSLGKRKDTSYGNSPLAQLYFWPEKLLLFITAGVVPGGDIPLNAGRGPGTSGPLYVVGLRTSPGCVSAAEVSLELDGGDG